MFKVHLLPLDKTLLVKGEMNLLQELKDQHLEIKSSCGGCASCGDCVIIVKEGAQNLSEQTFEEKRLLGNVFHITKERLSCQTKVTGDITIDISQHMSEKMTSSSPQKAKKVVVRKKADLPPPVEEKPTAPTDPAWFKHWEKEDKDPNQAKRLGGNKRPKPFTYQDDSDPENQ